MPPMLTIARLTPGLANAAAWKAGASGAPSPPAAISRRLKSAIVVMPVVSAMVLGSPSCRVKLLSPEPPERGLWRMVWPWLPMART